MDTITQLLSTNLTFRLSLSPLLPSRAVSTSDAISDTAIPPNLAKLNALGSDPQHSIRQRKARSQASSPISFIRLGNTQEDLEVHILGLSQLPEKHQTQQCLKTKLLYQAYQDTQFKSLSKDTQLLCLIPLLRFNQTHPTSIFRKKIKAQDLNPIVEDSDFSTLPDSIQALFHTYLDNLSSSIPSRAPVFQSERSSLDD